MLVADGFTIFLDSTFHIFVLLMYLPLIYRYVYRIVKERHSKNKAFMQAMGLRVFPYYMSWWASYTIATVGIATVCALIAYFSIFKNTNSSVLWVTLFFYG